MKLVNEFDYNELFLMRYLELIVNNFSYNEFIYNKINELIFYLNSIIFDLELNDDIIDTKYYIVDTYKVKHGNI